MKDNLLKLDAAGRQDIFKTIEEENEKAKKSKDKDKEKEISVLLPATLVVTLPESATLTIDGAATKSTTTTRTFMSPLLKQGKDYYYDLKAEFVRDGKTVSVSKRVNVRAGSDLHISMSEELGEAVTSR
jgi:uncharacterized protein (TIGR03000 family)